MPGNNSSAMASAITNWSRLERWFDIASKNLFHLSSIIQKSPDTANVLSVSRTGKKYPGKNWIFSFSVVWFEI